jgi:hypothetical protein
MYIFVFTERIAGLNIKLQLLKLFQYDFPEKQLIEIKNKLAKYFADTATTDMDKLCNEKGWSEKTAIDWANELLRKK